MKLGPVRDRLRERGFRHVHGALELAGLDKAPGQLPCLFVLPLEETASPNALAGAHDQALVRTIGVVLALRGAQLNDERLSDELAETEAKAIAALAGWTHPEASRPCSYLGGGLLFADRSIFLWLLRFTTARHIRTPTTQRKAT